MFYFLFFVFVAGLFAAIPLRTYALTLLIDPKTGFFLSAHPAVTAFYVVIAVCCLLFLSLCFSRRATPQGPFRAKGRFYGIAGLLCGALVVFQNLLTVIDAASGKGVPALDVGLAVFGVVAGFSLITLQFALLSGYQRWGVFRFLPLPLILWLCAGLTTYVFRTLLLVSVSQNLLDLLWQCSLVLALLAFSRCILGLDGARSRRLAAGFGLCTAFLGFSTYFPRCLAFLISDRYTLFSLFPGELTRLLFSVLCYSFAVSLLFEGRSPAKSLKPEAPETVGGYYYHARPKEDGKENKNDLFEDF